MSISSVSPTLPVVDLKRSEKFYQEKLGLKLLREDPSPGATLGAGGCELYIYQREPTKADHTVAAFRVDNVEASVKELRGKGIKFEEYDMPKLKTRDGIFSMDGYSAAWFKDPDGNIIAISNM